MMVFDGGVSESRRLDTIVDLPLHPSWKLLLSSWVVVWKLAFSQRVPSNARFILSGLLGKRGRRENGRTLLFGFVSCYGTRLR